jgi:phage terminase large subunit
VSKTARLKIFSTCRNLIRCLSTIKADEKNCNDVATDPHELTHLPDSLRYWCVMHTVVPKERDERTDAERRADEMKKYKESRLSGGASSGRPRVLRR